MTSWVRTAGLSAAYWIERRDLESANFSGHVAAVEQHMLAVQFDANLARELGQSVGIRQIEAAFFGGQGDRAVHGPRVQEPEAEPPGQFAGGAAFAGTRGAVDGHDHGPTDRQRRDARDGIFGLRRGESNPGTNLTSRGPPVPPPAAARPVTLAAA